MKELINYVRHNATEIAADIIDCIILFAGIIGMYILCVALI